MIEDGYLINVQGISCGLIPTDELCLILNAVKKSIKHNQLNNITVEIIDKINSDLRREDYSRQNNDPPVKKPEPITHLYLIKDTILNTLKIGKSKSVDKRFYQIQNATSNKLKLLSVIKNAGNTESIVHEKFSHLRLASEWFTYDNSILQHFDLISA